MAHPENFIRAGLGAMILVVACGEVQPQTIPDHASAGVISAAPPEPEATRTVSLEENNHFTLVFGQWRRLFDGKLVVSSRWSGGGLGFKTQGLEYWFKECQLDSLPGSAQITFVLSHPWPSTVEVTAGTRDTTMSVALGALRDEIDINADFIASLCMGTEVSGQYRQGGKILTQPQIRNLVNERAKDFREAIQTGQIPRAITIQ